MPKFVKPTTHLVGCTQLDIAGLQNYLHESGNTEFTEEIAKALSQGLSPLDILCSFYAKLCYSSLTVGSNKNVSKTRDIQSNVAATLEHGHGSVFEHVWLNFVTHNCSRVFTHEMVRHRVGTAFSQQSGRYVRTENVSLVLDPVLEREGTKLRIEQFLQQVEDLYFFLELKLGLVAEGTDTKPPVTDMTEKKKLTSAIRRILPEGRANDIGWSVNIRALRHLIMMRTSRHAEWEIRLVFGDVFKQMQQRYPLMFSDATVEMVDGLPEVTGMRMQPYEIQVH